MAFNTTEFRQAFPHSGTKQPIASPAYFEASFDGLPACMNKVDGAKRKKVDDAFKGMKFRCQAADLPSRQILGMSREFNSPKKVMPYAALYQTLIVDFLETDGFDIRAFFDVWQDQIEGAHRNYMTEYYDNLIVPKFTLTAYNKSGVPISRWIFKNVFPMAVNVSQLNWSQQSQALNVPVELNFQKWEFEVINSSTGAVNNNPSPIVDYKDATVTESGSTISGYPRTPGYVPPSAEQTWGEFGSRLFDTIFKL